VGHFDDLSTADAAIMETFVVPRYLSLYGDLMLEMLLVSEAATMAHLGCRTGYPDLKLFELVPRMSLIGVDASLPALELARNKAHARGDLAIEYLITDEYPTGLDSDAFSHALCLHPTLDQQGRSNVFREMERVLYSGGQALMALPLRGSFQEIADLMTEYALKNDDAALSKALEAAHRTRPTIETLSEEMEAVGLFDVDVDIQQSQIEFDSGRALLEDPVCRLLIFPELRTWLKVDDIEEPLEYVAQAIDKYWSEDKMTLSLNIGCASARKR
jgi:SAM-dependent methyltransferase